MGLMESILVDMSGATITTYHHRHHHYGVPTTTIHFGMSPASSTTTSG